MLKKLEVLLHRNVRKILKITITMVIDEKSRMNPFKTVLQYSNHPVPASEAKTHLHPESGQELRIPNPHSVSHSVV